MNEIIKTKSITGATEYRNAAGDLHRLDGPAVIKPDGTYEYWFDNKKYSYEDLAADIFVF